MGEPLSAKLATRPVSVTFRYLAMESEGDAIPTWFSALSTPPQVRKTDRGVVLYFNELGPLMGAPGPIDVAKSPLVTLFFPRRRRGVLLTAGEVHFLPIPLRKQFPALHRISQDFSRWLRQFDCVFSPSAQSGEWDYYLEGSIRNGDSEVFALPEAMSALRSGQYFVADDDTDALLDRLCKSLHLRGVEGILKGEGTG